MKFCSAVLKELRIRDWEGGTDGRTNERTDIRITIYPHNFVCGGYNNTINLKSYQIIVSIIMNYQMMNIMGYFGYVIFMPHEFASIK